MVREHSQTRRAISTMGWITALAVAGLACFNPVAHAHEPPRTSLRTMTDQAELIFQGVVSKVEYGMVQGTESEEGELPQTFVTYQIENIEKGQAIEGKNVTLRFLGGPAKDGRILVVSNSPLFDVGERDLVFVQSNGESDCPLVDCDKGRFRVINNHMFTNDGHEVRLTAQGNIFFGKQHRLPEVMNNKIGNLPFNFEIDPDDAEGAEQGKGQYNQGEQLRIPGEHLNMLKFRDRVAQEKAKIRPEKLAALKPVQSMRPGQALKLRPHSPQAPTMRVAPERPEAAPLNEFDKQEAEWLMKNAMNPVFKEGPPGGLKPNLQIKPNLEIQRPLLPNLKIQKPLRVIPRGIESGGAEEEEILPLEGNMLFDGEEDPGPMGNLQP